MINFSVWGWPQYVYAFILLAGLTYNLYIDGSSKKGIGGAIGSLLATAVLVIVLAFGGFWR